MKNTKETAHNDSREHRTEVRPGILEEGIELLKSISDSLEMIAGEIQRQLAKSNIFPVRK